MRRRGRDLPNPSIFRGFISSQSWTGRERTWDSEVSRNFMVLGIISPDTNPNFSHSHTIHLCTHLETNVSPFHLSICIYIWMKWSSIHLDIFSRSFIPLLFRYIVVAFLLFRWIDSVKIVIFNRQEKETRGEIGRGLFYAKIAWINAMTQWGRDRINNKNCAVFFQLKIGENFIPRENK